MTDVTSLVPPPDGYVVDFANPQHSAQLAAFWCFGVGVFLSLLFTAQRVWVKWVLRSPWCWDDSKFCATAFPVQILDCRNQPTY